MSPLLYVAFQERKTRNKHYAIDIIYVFLPGSRTFFGPSRANVCVKHVLNARHAFFIFVPKIKFIMCFYVGSVLFEPKM